MKKVLLALALLALLVLSGCTQAYYAKIQADKDINAQGAEGPLGMIVGLQTHEILLQNSAFVPFNETGTFNYYCSIHPSMTGKIIVME